VFGHSAISPFSPSWAELELELKERKELNWICIVIGLVFETQTNKQTNNMYSQSHVGKKEKKVG